LIAEVVAGKHRPKVYSLLRRKQVGEGTDINAFNYFADLRMTFRQNFFLQDLFRNKFGAGLG
jgi:hypothetical protein